jgi:hypothetical protein
VEICDNVRNRLRQQVELEKRRKEEDLTEAYAQLEADKLAERNSKFAVRARMAIAGIGIGFWRRLAKFWRGSLLAVNRRLGSICTAGED